MGRQEQQTSTQLLDAPTLLSTLTEGGEHDMASRTRAMHPHFFMMNHL
jgi:hypothetical protein